MNLKQLFSRRDPSRAITEIQYGYSLNEFRDNPSNVASMATFLKSKFGKSVMSVLHHHSPRGYPLRGSSTVESAALEHMRREGYETAIMLLEAMAKDAPESDGNLTADWGVEEENDE
jgi:hypothetical protein